MRHTKDIIKFLQDRRRECVNKINIDDVKPKMNQTDYSLAQLDLCEELLNRIHYEELEGVN